MFDKISTRLHEINENPKYRFVLDLLCISILTLALVFCFLGAQGCLGAQTVYAAEEETLTITFGDLPSVEVPSRFSDYCIAYNNGGSVDAFFVDLTADSNTFSVCYDASNHYKVILYTDSASDRLWYRYSSGAWKQLGDVISVAAPGSGGVALISGSSTAQVLYSSSDIFEPDNTTVGYTSNYTFPAPPIPPFSLETFATDYIPLVTSSIIDVFVAFAKFCVESPVVIASIALSFIGYAIVKARDSARGV